MAGSFHELFEKFKKPKEKIVDYCERIGVHTQTYWRWSKNKDQAPPIDLVLEAQERLESCGQELRDKQILTVYRHIKRRKAKE